MTFNLNQNLPLKYQLEAYAALPSYPTGQDFIFEILSYLIRVSESKSKTFDPADIRFSTKTLKYVFGDKMNDASFLDQIKLIMKSMIEDGTLIKKGEFILLTQSEFQKYYAISN